MFLKYILRGHPEMTSSFRGMGDGGGGLLKMMRDNVEGRDVTGRCPFVNLKPP